jgi:hypothetical protein
MGIEGRSRRCECKYDQARSRLPTTLTLDMYLRGGGGGDGVDPCTLVAWAAFISSRSGRYKKRARVKASSEAIEVINGLDG